MARPSPAESKTMPRVRAKGTVWSRSSPASRDMPYMLLGSNRKRTYPKRHAGRLMLGIPGTVA
ncbi:hypothetical protein GCM10012278_00080 [Nonomuraea glycinis]|uniref:Uncharacterized protein n=1 Tax=Nonomuraea glycinis TaxID=2047744 RepID=A0A918E110_9ACTN|nr:hypothetical protein GCM10012278_00080 [Nonomuraea glycinis]